MGLSSTIYLAYASCFSAIASSPLPKKGFSQLLILFVLVLILPVILLVSFVKMSCLLAVPCAYLVLCLAAFCRILTLNTMTPIFLCPCGDLLACILEVKWLHILSSYAITMLQNNYCCQLYYFSAYIC